MTSDEKATPPLTEEMLRENPKLVQVLTEQQRYKQQCRLRALDSAFNERVKILVPDKEEPEADVLTNADKYYNWLIQLP